MRNELAAQGWGAEELFQHFGAISIPKEVEDWAANSVGDLSSMFVADQKTGLRFSLDCDKDSMSHANKGAVGIRLEFVTDVDLSQVQVWDVENVGLSRNP